MDFKILAPRMNKRSLASSAFKSQIDSFIRAEEADNRLRMVLGSTNKHLEALEYQKSSSWTIEQLSLFAQVTGELPPDDVKEYPGETLQTFNMALSLSNTACSPWTTTPAVPDRLREPPSRVQPSKIVSLS